MRKTSEVRPKDEPRREYDLTKLERGVRGKYYQQAVASTNLILIEPELLEIFPDAASVNRALRLLADTATAAAKKSASKKR